MAFKQKSLSLTIENGQHSITDVYVTKLILTVTHLICIYVTNVTTENTQNPMTKTSQFPIKNPIELLSMMFMSLNAQSKTVILSCAFMLTPNVH